MKKTILATALLLCSAITAGAQVLQMNPNVQPKASFGNAARHALPAKATITPSENQAWWGYISASDQPGGLGVSAADTYHCAIAITADNEFTAGKTIKAIRFYAMSRNIMTNVKVWIAEALPTTLDETSCQVLVDVERVTSGINDVKLTSDYTVPEKTIYVGYSFTVKSVASDAAKYPIAITGAPNPNSLWLRTETKVPEWGNLYQNNYGSLFLQVLLEGEFANKNAATMGNFSNLTAAVGQQALASVPITNQGVATINSIGYTVAYDGVEGPEQSLDVTPGIDFTNTSYVQLPIAASEAGTEKALTVKLTKVNGVDNEFTEGVTGTGSLVTVTQVPHRRPVFEEFTGTWCGWCPRGFTGLELSAEQYGDDNLVAIAVHNQDPMQISSYNTVVNQFVDGFPSALLSREGSVDPYYGLRGDGFGMPEVIDIIKAETVAADIDLKAQWNADSTIVTANTDMIFRYSSDNAHYQLGYVLIADSLSGTSSDWDQVNYFAYIYEAGQSARYFDANDPNIRYWCERNDGTSGDYPVAKGLKFNHVAIYADNVTKGIMGSVAAPIVADEVKTHTRTIELSKAKNTRSQSLVQNKKNLKVAVLLFDTTTGNIINAAKVAITGDEAQAISTLTATPAGGREARFSLSGTRMTAPQKGLNIVRSADGSVRKVLVK